MYLYEARRLRLPVLYDLDDPLFSISAYETYENMKGILSRYSNPTYLNGPLMMYWSAEPIWETQR